MILLWMSVCSLPTSKYPATCSYPLLHFHCLKRSRRTLKPFFVTMPVNLMSTFNYVLMHVTAWLINSPAHQRRQCTLPWLVWDFWSPWLAKVIHHQATVLTAASVQAQKSTSPGLVTHNYLVQNWLSVKIIRDVKYKSLSGCPVVLQSAGHYVLEIV